MDSTVIKRVVLQNYKSIADCAVELAPLMFLVGPNGSGKSNFLDALRFVKDALRFSLDGAVRGRGGFNEIRRRSSRRLTHFGIRLDLNLPSGSSGHYAFRIGARARGDYEVQQEECLLVGPFGEKSSFRVHAGNAILSNHPAPPASPDRLYLVTAASFPEFREAYDALSSMAFYHLNPERIRDLQSPNRGDRLARDGSNLASVLGQMHDVNPEMKTRVEEYLRAILPNVRGVDTRAIGPKETVEFRQGVAGEQAFKRFLAANMSDGTLRALGILVALFHARDDGRSRISLVGIEEPEMALHPAAAGVLLDGLRDASTTTQVLVTSHSPDLLDNDEIDTDSILAVALAGDTTQIGRLDQVSRFGLRDHLYTAGELLSLGQLRPDPITNGTSSNAHHQLFDSART